MNFLNDTDILDVLERYRSRFYGKYRGVCTEVDEATMRIKAQVPAVLGDTVTGWCMPCVPFAADEAGFAFLPEVGSGVWIEFEAGDVSYPIWVGCYWHAGKTPPDAKADVKVIVSAAKQKVLFDQGANAVKIEDDHSNKVTLDSSGIVADRGGKKVAIGSSKVDINSGALEVL